VANRVPVIFGETGETYDGSSCAASNIATFMKWVDAHATGYLAWTWDTWGNCSSLVSSYSSGAPANAFASWVHRHYLATKTG
jgi:hypothetical protein